MTKHFLFLDDNPDRHIAFDLMLQNKDVDAKHVWTAEECIKSIAEDSPYDCIMLDHDLGGQYFVEAVKGSGSEVAEFIGKQLDRSQYPKAIVIHSWNPAGAERMRKMISPSGIPTKLVPFQFSEK